MLRIGLPSPKFTTEAYLAGDFKKVSADDYKGKWLVLFFYPRDFTFICPTEIKGFAKAEADFNKLNASIVGASTDSAWCHKAWYERDLAEVKFPILADTTLAVAREFGVLIEESGEALRGTFIIDPEGVLRYSVVSDLGVGRSITETLRVLEALQTGERCPIDWQPGTATLGKG